MFAVKGNASVSSLFLATFSPTPIFQTSLAEHLASFAATIEQSIP
jgi:hypothetical protein